MKMKGTFWGFAIITICTGAWIPMLIFHYKPHYILGFVGCLLMTLSLGMRLFKNLGEQDNSTSTSKAIIDDRAI
jgi:hypothetical protein